MKSVLFALGLVLIVPLTAMAQCPNGCRTKEQFPNAFVPNGYGHQYNHHGRRHAQRALTMPWHGNYNHVQYGQPVALVVPPTADAQTFWGWGTSGTRVVPIYHQFTRPFPGHGASGGQFQNTPRWPSDTNQYGVYYIRGPW